MLTAIRVAIGEAAGHVLAESLRAEVAVPPFANAAMDGYALRSRDTGLVPARLTVLGTIVAGDPSSVALRAGEAMRITTGAPMPAGADAVCMVERTHNEDGGTAVVIDETTSAGTNVRPTGSDIARGDVVFGPGTLLGPAHIGVLASLGVAELLVYPRPVVAVLSTGNEVSATGTGLAPGQIRDANRPALFARLRADGFGAVDLGVVGDDESLLAERLTHGASRCDAVVASGGVSVGERDLTKVVLATIAGAAMRSMQVAVKPAKPFAFGTLGPGLAPVFGLPGNPVAALVSYELFVRPALRLMAGHTVLNRPRFAAIAETGLPRRSDGRLHLLRVEARLGPDGQLRVRSSGGQGSHMLRAMAGANALALLPDGDGIRPGGRVEVLLLDADEIP